MQDLESPHPIQALLHDPVLTTELPHWAGEVYLTFAPQLTHLTEVVAGLGLPIGSVSGMAGLSGLAGLSQTASAAMPAVAPVPTPAPATPTVLPAAGIATPLGASGALPATVPAPTSVPTASTVAASAPPRAAGRGHGGLRPSLCGGASRSPGSDRG